MEIVFLLVVALVVIVTQVAKSAEALSRSGPVFNWKLPQPALLPGPRPGAAPELPASTEEARPARIADLRAGDYVAVVGTVVGSATLVAPLSGRLCMASDVAVFDHYKCTLVARALEASAFEVEDTTGRVTVDGRGAYLRLLHDRSTEAWEGSLHRKLSEQLPDTGWFDVHEGALLPGAQVLVIGEVQGADDDPGAGYRRPGDALRIAGGGERPALLSTYRDDIDAFLPG